MNRCKEEKLAAATTVAEADKLLVEMGCVVPGGASHTVKKEAAAAMVWMREHRLDKTEQFDALPEESKAALKGLYTVVPGASGMHWSKKIFRMFDAFSSADSPVKEPQAPRDDILPRVGELELADEQARPPDDAMDAMGVGGEREERARLAGPAVDWEKPPPPTRAQPVPLYFITVTRLRPASKNATMGAPPEPTARLMLEAAPFEKAVLPTGTQ